MIVERQSLGVVNYFAPVLFVKASDTGVVKVKQALIELRILASI